MTVPLFGDKSELPASYTPTLFLDALRGIGWEPGVVPETVIYTYARFELYLATEPAAYTPNNMLGTGPGRFFIVNDTDGRVGINCLGTGPSITAAQIELQAALGVERALIAGTAGGLLSDQSPGDLVLPTAAVRDDGTTDHYATSGQPAVPGTVAVRTLLRLPGEPRHRGQSCTVLDDSRALPHDRRRGRPLRRPRCPRRRGGGCGAVRRRRRPRCSNGGRARPRRRAHDRWRMAHRPADRTTATTTPVRGDRRVRVIDAMSSTSPAFVRTGRPRRGQIERRNGTSRVGSVAVWTWCGRSWPMTRRSTSPRSAGAAARHDGSRSGCSTWTAGSSSPGSPARRSWLANLMAHPGLTVHLKRKARTDLPARATVVTDPATRRWVLEHRRPILQRQAADWVPGSRRPRGPRRSRTNGRGHIRTRVAASVAPSGAKRRRKVKAVGVGPWARRCSRRANGVLHSWDRALRDPPEAQNRLARGLEEVMTASEKLDVAGAVGEIGEGVDRGPHREVDDLEVVLERFDARWRSRSRPEGATRIPGWLPRAC